MVTPDDGLKPGPRAVAPGLVGGIVVAGVLRVFMGQLGPLLFLPVLVGAGLALGVARGRLPSWATAAGLLLCLPALPAAVFLHLRVLAQTVPMPAQAEGRANRASFGDWTAPPFAQVTYRTALPFDEAAAFYRTELGWGWRLDHCFDMGEYTSYTYLRGWSRYLILIWAGDGGTREVQVTRYYPTQSPSRLLEGGCPTVTPIQILTPPAPDSPQPGR